MNEDVGYKLDRIIELLVKLNQNMEIMANKLGSGGEKETKEIHIKILNMLDSWMSARDLSRILGYRHEYISRMISELKKRGLILEKRGGKSILYMRKPD